MGQNAVIQPIFLRNSLKWKDEVQGISRQKLIMSFIFGMQINFEVFYRLILSFWVCVTMDAQCNYKK